MLSEKLSMKDSYVACTNYAFMLHETVAVAQLLYEGKTAQEIRDRVIADDLFQLRSIVSRRRSWQAVYQHLSQIDEKYIELLVTNNSALRRSTYLFLILKKNSLLRELIGDVILRKIQSFEFEVSRADLQLFWEVKREQNPTIAAWSTSTYRKTLNNILLILIKSELLKTLRAKKYYQILSSPVPAPLKQQLKSDGLNKYLILMLDKIDIEKIFNQRLKL